MEPVRDYRQGQVWLEGYFSDFVKGDRRQSFEAKELLERFVKYVTTNLDETIRLEDVATAYGVSDSQMCQNFRKKLNTTPMRLLWRIRARLARHCIEKAPELDLTTIAFRCGFSSSAHFSRSYVAEWGERPSEVRRNAMLNTDKNYRSPVDRINELGEDVISKVTLSCLSS